MIHGTERKRLENISLSGESCNVNAVKVDEAKRIRLPVLNPGDYYEAEYRGPEEIVLRRVPEPEHKVKRTKVEALHAIERSSLKFKASWEELRLETR
jgi:hypothetical protein